MADSRAASRYVKSLLGLSVERNALEAVHADMQLFAKVCESSHDLVVMLRSPIIKHDKKKAVLDAIFKGKVNDLTMAMIAIITRKNREPLLPEIAREFHAAYNEFKGIGKATLITTFAIDPKLREEIEGMVKTLSNRKQIELEEKVDPSLIGGFILNVGDKQVDASIRNRLRSLEVTLRHNPYIKEL